MCRDVSPWWIYSVSLIELPIVLCFSVNLFPYRLFIGALYHEAFNGNHQWCCHPNPFRSLLYCPCQFDEAIVIMSLCVCTSVEVCVCLSVLLSIITPLQVQGFSHSLHSVVCLFMHVCVFVSSAICTIANTALLSLNTWSGLPWQEHSIMLIFYEYSIIQRARRKLLTLPSEAFVKSWWVTTTLIFGFRVSLFKLLK